MCALTSDERGECLNSAQGSGPDIEASLTITHFSDLASLQSLRHEWDELLSACPDASIFSTPEWLCSWWEGFGEGRQLLILAFRHGRKLVGLAPLSLTREKVACGVKLRFLRFMGDGSNDSDNLGMIVQPGYEQSFTRSLVDHLSLQVPSWNVCQLRTMDPSSRATLALSNAIRDRNWPAYSAPRAWTVISLPETWELYRKMLSSKERGKLGTRTRRLEGRYQTVYHKCVSAAELPTRLETLYSLHAKRWQVRGLPGTFISAERCRMYRHMAERFLERGWLEFWFLELNGIPVATLYNFRYRDTVYSLQEGYDPGYSSDSIGYVLRGYVLKRFIEEGVRAYDFLQGKDPSKERWGAHVQNYLDFEFARPWTPGSLYLNLVHSAAKAKQMIRARVSQETWTVLHKLNLRLKGEKELPREAGEE
ncbi:MAG TPA: GNAT family N-acetyltransferase [Terriglobales bacterium]